jgi:hypothetical protein
MEAAEERPRAVVVLHRGAQQLVLGPVLGPGRCDLAFVDGLLRMQLLARRWGWSLRLRDVREDLRELVAMVGLEAELVDR